MHVRLDSIYDHRIAVNLNLQFTVPFLGRSFILISDVWRSCAGALLLLMKGSCGWQSRTWMSPAVKKDFLSTSRLIYPVDLWPSDAAEVSHRKMKRFCFLFFLPDKSLSLFFPALERMSLSLSSLSPGRWPSGCWLPLKRSTLTFWRACTLWAASETKTNWPKICFRRSEWREGTFRREGEEFRKDKTTWGNKLKWERRGMKEETVEQRDCHFDEFSYLKCLVMMERLIVPLSTNEHAADN